MLDHDLVGHIILLDVHVSLEILSKMQHLTI